MVTIPLHYKARKSTSVLLFDMNMNGVYIDMLMRSAAQVSHKVGTRMFVTCAVSG